METILAAFPEVTVIANAENLGFAGGNNVGIRVALDRGADCVLLLNNDTTVDPGLLKAFVNAARSVEGGGVFAAKIYYSSHPTRIWYGGSRWIDALGEFAMEDDGLEDERPYDDALRETDIAVGCALFVQASIVREIGLLDEEFFLLHEEADWCFRARRKGYRSYVVPAAKVWHKVSVSFCGIDSPLMHYFQMRNRLLWGEKNLALGRRVALTMKVLRELVDDYIAVPRFSVRSSSNVSLFKNIYWTMRASGPFFRERHGRAVRIARRWGVRDYFLRRFGNCPDAVRALGKGA